MEKADRAESKKANIQAYDKNFKDTREISYQPQYIRNAYLNDVLCLK